MRPAIKGLLADLARSTRDAAIEKLGGVTTATVARFVQDFGRDLAKLEAERDKADFAAYVARLDAARQHTPSGELAVGKYLFYRSVSTETYVIRLYGRQQRLVDEATATTCIARGVALGLLAGPERPSAVADEIDRIAQERDALRTERPDSAKRQIRAKNPDCRVIDCAESDIAKMTGAARG